MMLANSTRTVQRAATCSRAASLLPARPLQCRRSTVVRFQEDNKAGIPKISDADRQKVVNTEEGNISPANAERRADLGNAWDNPQQIQAFDGPAPETINGRLAMLGVVTGLAFEFTTGLGLRQQFADHPLTILASFIIIALASYVPITRGYTRKEPFENGIWTARNENFNGRVAMLGFTAMILTEALAGQSTVAFWASRFGGM
jgi:hypothetical protein